MSLRWRLFLALALIVVICLGMVAIAATAILQSQRDRLATEQLHHPALRNGKSCFGEAHV